MRSYIFFTPNLSSVGGQQLYLDSKIKWLKDIGYKVNVISVRKGKIFINDLKSYKDNVIEELTFSPHYWSERKRNRIIEKVIRLITVECNDIIIESNSAILSSWAEIISRKIKAKHIFFSLLEKNSAKTTDIHDFYKFKLKRGELATIKEETFKSVFINNWKEVPKLKAYMNNLPEDYDHVLLKSIKPSNYTIGVIGRLEKPFVIPALKQIEKFTSKHPIDIFNLIMIGGSSNKRKREEIKKYCDKIANLNLYVTDFIHPIPIKLIQIPDVFISSAGSSRISAHSNKLTVTIDSQDYNPIGVLGITTHNTIYRNNDEPIIELSDLLEDILYKNKYSSDDINLEWTIFNPDYSDHINFINKSEKEKDYYSFDLNTVQNKFKRRFINIFGIKGFRIFHFIKQRYIKMVSGA